MGIDPETHKPRMDFNHLMNLSQLLGISNMGNSMSAYNPLGLQPDITQLAKVQLLQNMLQIMNNNPFVTMGNNNINPYNLLGNPSPYSSNMFLSESGTNNTLQTKEPVVFSSEEYANQGFYSLHGQSESSQQDIPKGGSNLYDFDYGKMISSTSSGNQEETLLPGLVASSPKIGTFTQMDNECNKAQKSIQSPSNTIFDDWEKFLDHESNGSYWKELLE